MDYRAYAREQAQRYGLDPALVEAVMAAESAGNPNAVSKKGAIGLMQLMPETARELGVNPKDPLQNIEGGVRYLKQQVDRYGVEGGLAAYNAGGGRYEKSGRNLNAMPDETRAYVPNVMNRFNTIAQGGSVTQDTTSRPKRTIAQNRASLEKATAAGDQGAIDYYTNLITTASQSALKKAQDANDTEAVAHYTNILSSVTKQPSTGTAPAITEPPPLSPEDVQPPPDINDPTYASTTSSFSTPQITEGGAILTGRRKGIAGGKQVTPEDSLGKVLQKATDEAVRGAADALTFGYADELAAKAGSSLGFNPTINDTTPLIPDQPKTYQDILASERAIDAQGGVPRLVGQVGGSLLAPTLAIRGLDTLGRGGRTLAGAATGGAQGFLAGTGAGEGDWANRVESGIIPGLIGTAAGGTLGALMPATTPQKVNQFIREAGSPEQAATNAEIIKRLQTEFNNPARAAFGSTPDLGRAEVNALVTKDILKQAKDVVATLPKSVDKAKLMQALNTEKVSQRTLDELASIPGGSDVVNVINQAVTSSRMTAPIPASDNIVLRGLRGLSDVLPIPSVINRNIINPLLSGRTTSQGVTSNLINKYGGLTEDILAKTGVSPATASMENLSAMASKAVAKQQAAALKTSQDKATKAAQELVDRNAVLKETRMPLGGGFQELLQGGRSGLNLTSDQAIEALRLASTKGAGTPVGQAADIIRRSGGDVTDSNAFYGLQNQIRKFKEQGVLSPDTGALTQPVSDMASTVAKTAGTSRVPSEFFTSAKNAISTVDDNTLSNILSRTTNQAGESIANPRGYATGKVAQMLYDRDQGRALSEEAKTILKWYDSLQGSPGQPLQVTIKGILSGNQ